MVDWSAVLVYVILFAFFGAYIASAGYFWFNDYYVLMPDPAGKALWISGVVVGIFAIFFLVYSMIRCGPYTRKGCANYLSQPQY